MSRRATAGRGRGAPPAFVVPADMDKKTKRQVQQLIDHQLREAQGRPLPAPKPFRFRFQLVPLTWLAGACAGLACHAGHAYALAVLAALGTTAATVIATRHRKPFPRWHAQGSTAWAGLWLVILAFAGLGPWAALGLAGWFAPSCFWWHHYAWRGPAAGPAKPDTSVADTWAELAAVQKWDAWLGPPQPIDNGTQWPIICKGSTTHIGKITAKRDEVAAAFDKAITEAYTEPAGSGIRSRGMLTILRRGTLDVPRRWDGGGIDLATGLAVAGRYPDGQQVHERFWAPGVGGGVRHTIIAGADGTGKTGLIDLSLAISARSGRVCPVILDPQEGQALPAWQDVVPYACGPDECMAFLRRLHAAMFERSADLAKLWWRHPVTGRRRKGIGFYDYDIIAAARAEVGLPPLPVIEITIDEAPVLLALKGAAPLILDILKLGRKVGFRVRLAAQVPSIAELGKGEIRSILNGGNVFCFRTGDRLTAGMAGIPANPNELPLTWSDGITPTVGLGFAKTVDARPGVTMRTDWLEDPYTVAEESRVPGLDEQVAARIAAAVAATGEQLDAVQQAAADGARVQLEVLGILAGRPMTAGQLISGATAPVSAIVDALAVLEADGRIRKSGDLFEKAGP